MDDRTLILIAALREIASRGEVEGYSSLPAVRLRLVLTQSIARQALADYEASLRPEFPTYYDAQGREHAEF